MKRYMWGFVIALFIYLFVLSLGHSYYLTQVNKGLEIAIADLVEQIAEIKDIKEKINEIHN